MNNPLLQKAIECLKIRDVFQRATLAEITEEFEPKYSDVPLRLQFKHVVTQSQIIEVDEDKEDNDEPCLFRVYIELGARWVIDVSDGEETPSEEDDGAEVMALIDATFVAEYQIEGKPGKDALNEFALKNASYHVWPYWREYLMSQSMRMNLPKIVLPAVQFAVNKDDSSTDNEHE